MAMRLELCEPAWEPWLVEELRQALPRSAHSIIGSGAVTSELADAEESDEVGVALGSQCLPDYQEVEAASVSQWSAAVAAWLIGALREHEGPWRLHMFSASIEEQASLNRRAKLISAEVTATLKKKQRRLLRTLVQEPTDNWSTNEGIAQIALAGRGRGYVSWAPPDVRYKLRRCLSRFPGGHLEIPANRAAPSRAFAKLAEVEIRMGREIEPGESCVDLGSSPGSWTWWAACRRARVTAVDRSPLRGDLMNHSKIQFVRGDAFKFEPAAPVDWLLSDIVAFPQRILELLDQWLQQRWCRQFCVTIKFRGTDDYAVLGDFKRMLAERSADFVLRRLTNNKHEVTAFGFAKDTTSTQVLVCQT